MGRSIWRHRIVQAAALGSLLATMLVASSAGAATGAPSAPRAVRASGAATTISVRWTSPAVVGADAVREYVVTSHPLSRTCVTRTTTCEVKGLTPGAAYTFTVVARNGYGASAAALSNRIDVAKSGAYFVSRLNAFNVAETSDETALGNATTTAEEREELTALAGSFNSLVTSLTLEKWPAAASRDVGTFVADMRVLRNGTIGALEASTTSAMTKDQDVVQGEANRAVVAESNVFSRLGLKPPIVPPSTTTPTPVALGTAQTVTDLFGDQVTVTATHVVDPATAAAGSGSPDAGSRFVAVELELGNSNAGTVGGDADFASSVVGSDGKVYSADFGTVSECSNFSDGYFELPAGDSASGCVVFELPTAVTVKSIQFSLAPGYLKAAEWTP